MCELQYKVGLKALELIEELVGVNLTEDEAGFIAFHIVNASLNEDFCNTVDITLLTNQILKIIKKHFSIDFSEDSFNYIRLVTHLKFFSQRIFKREQISKDDDNLYKTLSKQYIEETKYLNTICKYIKKQYNYTLTSQEKLYLMIHIKKNTTI